LHVADLSQSSRYIWYNRTIRFGEVYAMSFKKNDYQQMTLHDSFLNLSPRVKKIVENSWCSDFANIVFPAINEEAFAVLYSCDP
jgi:hypothetical protein